MYAVFSALKSATLRSFSAALMLGVAACATAPTDPGAKQAAEEVNDPIEPFNRQVFQFNRGLDFWLLKPLATTYNDLVPNYGKDRIRSALDNLREPVNFANNMLQGQWERAWRNIERFAVNSTIGVAGLYNPLDIEPAKEDFGQTLAVWGVGEGPFLMLPLVGPSNPRDAGGLLGDAVMDPFNIAAVTTGLNWLSYLTGATTALDAIDTRARYLKSLDEIERTSIDYYAAIRSLYRQSRNDDIRNGKSGDSQLPKFSDSFDDDIHPAKASAAN